MFCFIKYNKYFHWVGILENFQKDNNVEKTPKAFKNKIREINLFLRYFEMVFYNDFGSVVQLTMI